MSDVLAERAVVVTGAGKGLGRAYAEHAASLGARVVVNDVDAAAAEEVVRAIAAAGGDAVVDASDVSTVAGAERAIAASVEAFGSLDGLVNNAGIMYEAQLWEADLTRFERILQVNVLGTIFCTAAAVSVMKGAGGGAIVNAGSLAANGYPRNDIYAASKGAVTSFTYSAALELEAVGIRINTIWPSALTPMVREMMAASTRPETVGQDKRMAKPAAIAPLVSYLLSPMADGVTGQTFHFNGTMLGLVEVTPLAESPNVVRDAGWSFEEIVAAVNSGDLAAQLQPYGPLGTRVPPRAREAVAASS